MRLKFSLASRNVYSCHGTYLRNTHEKCWDLQAGHCHVHFNWCIARSWAYLEGSFFVKPNLAMKGAASASIAAHQEWFKLMQARSFFVPRVTIQTESALPKTTSTVLIEVHPATLMMLDNWEKLMFSMCWELHWGVAAAMHIDSGWLTSTVTVLAPATVSKRTLTTPWLQCMEWKLRTSAHTSIYDYKAWGGCANREALCKDLDILYRIDSINSTLVQYCSALVGARRIICIGSNCFFNVMSLIQQNPHT